MNEDVFFVLYLFFSSILILIFAICILLNDKRKYLTVSLKSLNSLCDSCRREMFDIHIFPHEINKLYNRCVQEMPRLKKHYPNVVVWIDAIIFIIDLGKGNAYISEEYILILREARNILEMENPFSKCDKYQQSILCDIQKMKTCENEILVQNIINRTEEEFLRLSGDIKKNELLNIISIAIGVVGIVVSILMAIMKF